MRLQKRFHQMTEDDECLRVYGDALHPTLQKAIRNKGVNLEAVIIDGKIVLKKTDRDA